MSKKPGSVITAEQHARNAFKRIDAKQTFADREASPEFQENYLRLRAERLAREAAARAEKQPAPKPEPTDQQS